MGVIGAVHGPLSSGMKVARWRGWCMLVCWVGLGGLGGVPVLWERIHEAGSFSGPPKKGARGDLV